MRISISSDHGGYELKSFLIEELKKEHEVIDMGCDSKESVDYPIYTAKAAKALSLNEVDRAIVICTNGVGAAIVANKFRHVRCALCVNKDMAEHARLHNNANALGLGQTNQSFNEALEITKIFLNTEFTDKDRHLRRVNEINKLEEDM